MSERFVDVGSVDNFIAEQENKATLQKTQRDVKLLQTFLGTRNELRKVEEIPALEFNEYICEFIISVRTKDGKDLWAFFAPKSIGKFWTTSKKEQLLCQYREWGNKKSPPVQTERVKEERKRKQAKRFDNFTGTSDELNTLYETGLLGSRNPEALLNTLWLNSTIHFGLRGCKEHRDMCWGDVKLKETADGKEYLEFNERQTKTRTSSDCHNIEWAE